MAESLLTKEEIKTIFEDIGDSMERHNKMYWWEVPLVAVSLCCILLFFIGVCVFLIKVLSISDTLSAGITMILCMIVMGYFMIVGYDYIKSRIIVKIKYG